MTPQFINLLNNDILLIRLKMKYVVLLQLLINN